MNPACSKWRSVDNASEMPRSRISTKLAVSQIKGLVDAGVFVDQVGIDAFVCRAWLNTVIKIDVVGHSKLTVFQLPKCLFNAKKIA